MDVGDAVAFVGKFFWSASTQAAVFHLLTLWWLHLNSSTPDRLGALSVIANVHRRNTCMLNPLFQPKSLQISL
jgi:hypothetical protein